jgi:hypothetical protein
MARTFLISMLLVLPLQAAITLEPSDPRAGERVFVTVVEVESCPGVPIVTRSGNDVTIALGSARCNTPPTAFGHRIDLGILHAGTHNLTVTDGSGTVESTAQRSAGVLAG